MIERMAIDPEVEESPNFLGGLYNLVTWKPKVAEHEYLRNMAPKVHEMAPDFTLPLLGGGLGLNRPAPGDGREPSGPQVADLAALYDADLVGLMIPGMVVS